VWQKVYDEVKDRNFIVISVAMDSVPGAAEPWIEQAKPTYPVLLDREHRLAALYHMVNVPQAVWIDERGKIVRPTECAGSYDGFRQMDRITKIMPEETAKINAAAKATYAAAVKDWALKGEASEHAFDPEDARRRIPALTESQALAHTMFRLGQALLRQGRTDEGDQWLRRASELHPDSWCMWRQRAGKDDTGLAALPDFWERVDALGERPYHWRVDMKGMPR